MVFRTILCMDVAIKVLFPSSETEVFPIVIKHSQE